MRKILIVDDNEKNLKLLKLLIEPAGYTVITANCGTEGLQRAQEQEPQLVITDVQMEGMDGASLLKAIRADGKIKNVPVVALTFIASDNERCNWIDAGFDDCLKKPISREQLLICIDDLIKKRYVKQKEPI